MRSLHIGNPNDAVVAFHRAHHVHVLFPPAGPHARVHLLRVACRRWVRALPPPHFYLSTASLPSKYEAGTGRTGYVTQSVNQELNFWG